ncbi:MAG TPA: hypothetical protein VEC16_03810 [Alphaproteobacteria bacterium]|nr:hypothetical protein [Alphaproteobacteria bacterium]
MNQNNLEGKVKKGPNIASKTLGFVALGCAVTTMVFVSNGIISNYDMAKRDSLVTIRNQVFAVNPKEKGYEISTIERGDTLKAADVNGDGIVDHSITNTQNGSNIIELYNIFDPYWNEMKITPVPREVQYAYDTVMHVYNNEGKLKLFKE